MYAGNAEAFEECAGLARTLTVIVLVELLHGSTLHSIRAVFGWSA